MKKLLTFIFALFLFQTFYAQSPSSMGYQAVIRDASNVLVDNQAIGMRISILQGSASGTAVYVETQISNSNDNGLVTIQIGDGTVVSGNFSTIDWSNGPYFVKTETDPTGGTSYTITGTSQLMSVPYALHATTADSIAGPSAWTINGDHIYPSPSGNVGIGTTAIPNSKMYILNDEPAVITFKNSTSGQGAFSQFYNSDESVRGIIGVDGAGYSGTPNQFSISTWTNHPIDFRTNTQSRMLIDETGNVGIGTSDPSSKLDVVGDFQYSDGSEGQNKVLTSDANGNATWQENLGEFASSDGVVKNISNISTDDFLVGGDSLANGLGTHDDIRLFFDKSKGAFRAGLDSTGVWNDSIVGLYSTAMGFRTTASGNSSTAMGSLTTASGSYSSAMGYSITASGSASTAMGYISTATGSVSTAMGHYTTASGDNSTAMGYGTTALGDNSTAMGQGTIASGDGSTAMGFTSRAFGRSSIAMGHTSKTIGNYSIAGGAFAEATGISSIALGGGVNGVNPGLRTKALGDYSIALGRSTRSEGNYSFAVGESARAIGSYSTAIGRIARSIGNYSFAAGNLTEAVGIYSTALGRQTKSSGSHSFAAGYLTQAVGISSTAMGDRTQATGLYSTAMGWQTKSSGGASFASGYLTEASGSYSTAMGRQTKSSGSHSFATGYLTQATKPYSTAMGFGNISSGNASTSIGVGINALSFGEVTVGISNELYTPISATTFDENDRIFSIGNGTSNTDRSNAVTILKNGKVGIGISTPNSTLDVYGAQADLVTVKNNTSVAGVHGAFTQWYNSDNSVRGIIGADGTGLSANPDQFTIGSWTNSAMDFRTNAISRMHIDNDGNIGIGTTTPTAAKLVISGSQSSLVPGGSFGYLASNGTTGVAGNTVPYSILTSDRIAASEFNAYSDVRIKKVEGISDVKEDLETLSKIEITDYIHIDTIGKGNLPYKKVIAQQVKEVFPQAVTANLTQVIPNIYQLSEIKNGWIPLNADVIVGDKVKLIFSKKEEMLEVTEVDSKGFKVKSDASGKVFVFGKEVDDFHTVDYEAISMLNVSATQALLKRIEQLENEKLSLKKDLDNFKATTANRLDDLELKIKLSNFFVKE